MARQAAPASPSTRARTRLPAVQVILHGGEPLMARPPRLRQVIGELRSALDGICDLDLRIHTNGVLLDEPDVRAVRRARRQGRYLPGRVPGRQ